MVFFPPIKKWQRFLFFPGTEFEMWGPFHNNSQTICSLHIITLNVVGIRLGCAELPILVKFLLHWIAQVTGGWLSSWIVCHLGAQNWREKPDNPKQTVYKHQCPKNIHCWGLPPHSYLSTHTIISSAPCNEYGNHKIKMPSRSLEVNYVQGKKKSSNISAAWFLWKILSKPELLNIEQNEEWKGFYPKEVSHSAT